MYDRLEQIVIAASGDKLREFVEKVFDIAQSIQGKVLGIFPIPPHGSLRFEFTPASQREEINYLVASLVFEEERRRSDTRSHDQRLRDLHPEKADQILEFRDTHLSRLGEIRFLNPREIMEWIFQIVKQQDRDINLTFSTVHLRGIKEHFSESGFTTNLPFDSADTSGQLATLCITKFLKSVDKSIEYLSQGYSAAILDQSISRDINSWLMGNWRAEGSAKKIKSDFLQLDHKDIKKLMKWFEDLRLNYRDLDCYFSVVELQAIAARLLLEGYFQNETTPISEIGRPTFDPKTLALNFLRSAIADLQQGVWPRNLNDVSRIHYLEFK